MRQQLVRIEARRERRRGSTLLAQIVRSRYLYLAILPALAFLLVFEWYPAVSAFYNSLFLWNGGKVHVFVGLQNFTDLFRDDVFWTALRNMAFFVLFRVVGQTILPFLGAELIINLRSERGSNWWKMLFVFPMVMPHVLMYLIWRFVYNPQIGLLNQVLRLVGLDGLTRAWLSDPATALTALSFVRFPWLATLQFLIILGALQAIPREVSESARIDGAGPLARIWYVDLPMIRKQLVLAMILTAIFMTQRFDNFLILTDGGPGYATMVPGLQLYRSAFNFLEFGYASAIGVVMFVIMLALTVLNLRWSSAGGER